MPADDPLLATLTDLYGISDTADPPGGWHLYALHADESGATWATLRPWLQRESVAIGVDMFAAGSLKYVRGRLVALDYAVAAGRHAPGNPVGINLPGSFALLPRSRLAERGDAVHHRAPRRLGSATCRFWAWTARP